MTSAEGITEPNHSPRTPEATLIFLSDFGLSKSREALIREVAYLRSSRRGFLPGHELEDWLTAEQQVDGYLALQIPLGFYG